jgi:PD-(D/E)XK nuclease superfamily
MRWSYSGLKDFLNCPRQFDEVKLKKNYVKKVTEQMTYGTDVHEAFERYVKDNIDLPEFYQKFKPVLDELVSIPGKKHTELKMGLRADHSPCGFDDPDYSVRGIVDLLIIDGDSAYLIDYKTGSAKYPDPKQLKLMAIMVFAHFPVVQSIRAGLLFVVSGQLVPEEYKRDDNLWYHFQADLSRMEMSFLTQHFPANPSGLCPWCPVESCEFYRPKKY